MNILIIEDEILIQKSLKILLEKHGFKVTCTDMGKIAISLIESNNYDKIICDLMLKDISGFDVIEESKRRYSSKEISQKFTIITAYSSLQIITKAKNYGCKIINKPFQSGFSSILNVLGISNDRKEKFRENYNYT